MENSHLSRTSVSRIYRAFKKTGIRGFKSIGKGDFVIKSSDILRLYSLPKKAISSVRVSTKKIKIINPEWTLFSFKEIFENEVYLLESENHSPLIIDCGSNIGLSIIYFKSLFPDARVLGFEPDPLIFGLLKENITEFDLSDVDLIQKAVWTENSDQVPFIQDKGLGGRLAERSPYQVTVAVETVRLKEFLVTPIDLLKLDIEGAEFAVLSDVQQELKFVKSLFVEYHSKADEPQKLGQLLEILRNAGFRYHIKDAYPIAHPFIKDERQSSFDLQLNIYAFRE
jgi:FkbM family methyltransferase